MIILVINCGSSSIKFKLYNMKDDNLMLSGIVDKIGLSGSSLRIDPPKDESICFEGEIDDHNEGIQAVLAVLTHSEYGVLDDVTEINAVGHRVVHGGEMFQKSVLIDDEVLESIVVCSDLAPLHNPPNYLGIIAVQSVLPDVPQVAVFDTSFHQTMAPHAYMYAIPYSLYKKYGLRRYGFHGTSHRYVSRKSCELTGLDYNKSKIISCHLGGGASVAAILNGKSIDTSMGLTPVEGMIMGTRSGDLDLGVLTYIMNKEEIGVAAANHLINKHSGMLGITGISSDMRDIEQAANRGDERSKLALDMYEYRIKKYIGAYAASLGGLDMIVFTGGIGENDNLIRAGVCRNMEYMGCHFDYTLNEKVRGEACILSTPESKVFVTVMPTNEELMIAQDTLQLIKPD
ncbi:MAG: acetate kinase [Acidobacteria bacterium]|nr:MAG: acetate kinase [Acidobacteriota bacterium]